MTIVEYDQLDAGKKRTLLFQCCGSTAWVEKMLQSPPAEDLVDLLEIAEENWCECGTADWREAFGHHPKIGDLESLKTRFASTADLAGEEQKAVEVADEAMLQSLAAYNDKYQQKFGHIFIVSATGKSAGEMLGALQTRLNNPPGEELQIAADEQLKITKLRLQKLFL